MNVLNYRVNHEKYGHGVIVMHQDNHITVEFDEFKELHEFVFPTCFKSELSFREEHIGATLKGMINSNAKINISLEKINTVFIYKGNRNCCSSKHQLEAVIASILLKIDKSLKTYNIPVTYCNSCKKYFISEVSLSIYEEQYGIYVFNKIKSICNFINTDSAVANYGDESIMYKHGYTAVEGKLTMLQRQKILMELIDNDIMSKVEIREHLNYLIKYRGKRCYKAVNVWQSDIVFIDSYKSNNERRIIAEFDSAEYTHRKKYNKK